MAAVSNLTKFRLATQAFDWLGVGTGVLLLSPLVATNLNHEFVNELGGELSGPGYERKTLVNKTLARDDANNVTVMSADGLLWTGIDAGHADRLVLFEEGASDAERRIISYHLVRNSNGNSIMTNGGDLPYDPHDIFGYLSVIG